MRANINLPPQRPQGATGAPQMPQTGKLSTLEIARLALIQGLANGTSIELLFACAAETIAVLTHDDELRQQVRQRAGIRPFISTQQ